MNQQHKEIELTFELVSRQFEFLEDSKDVLPSQRTVFKELIFGRDHPIKRRLTIDGHDEASFGESLLLNFDRRIADGGSRCDFIA